MKKTQSDFKKKLFDKSVNKKMLFHYLKVNYTFDDQEVIIKATPKLFNSLVYGKPVLKSEEELGKQELTYLNSYSQEINWNIHQFVKFADLINDFIIKKEDFENHFILGNYESSKKNLEDIRNLTASYWYLENHFLYTQNDKGLEFNFKLLKHYQKLKVSDPAFYFFIHFFSYKVEEDISYFGYLNAVEASTKQILNEPYKEYLDYRLNSMNHEFSNLDNIFWATSNLPVIDKYLLFRDVFFHLISSSNQEKDEFIRDKSRYLLNFIEDPLLTKVENFYSENFDFIQDSLSQEELKIIDLFTRGKYAEVINSSKHFFQTRYSFSIMELFAKAHIHLNLPIEKIGSEDSLLNKIIETIFNYLARNEKSNEALVDLFTIANSISSFNLAKEIISFLRKNLNSDDNRKTLQKSYLFSHFFNPLHFRVFKDSPIQISYLESFSNSITADFFKEIQTNPKKINVQCGDKIPLYRRLYYTAKSAYEKKDYGECEDVLRQLFLIIDDILYLKEQSISMLFDCYFKQKKYNEAIDLYVNSLIENSFLVSKTYPKQLAEQIIKDRWKYVLHDNINFPIFIHSTIDEIHPKFIAYDLYMRSAKVEFPSKLKRKKGEKHEHFTYFLRTVAIPKIISRKAMVFKNSTSVLKERIFICQILSKIDHEAIEDYNKEISEITQRLTVKQRINEIDQSKIYVDESGILDAELVEVKKAFNRFKNISELLKQNKIDATGIGYDALYDLLQGKIDTDTYKKSLRKTDLHFELFTQLFLQIRDKFLFSNQYGLDYYLSQRIRHGTIIGQIRKPFKAHNLVTTKASKEGDYLPNKYWMDKLEISESNKSDFEDLMTDFSVTIDNIINDLKDHFIQIRTEDPKTKQTGWFDYRYIPLWNSEWLYSLFIKEIQFYTDFTEFAKSIFEILWQITDRNLHSIRLEIDQQIKVELVSKLDKLEVDLKRIIPSKSSNSIYRSIAECRTHVQADVDYVARWFNKSKNDEIDFSIEDSLNTSLKIVNNIISPAVLEIEQQVNVSRSIKGVFFPHFVDLIKIFLTNIYDYNKNHSITNSTALVEIIEVENKLIMEFSNGLADNENEGDLLLKLEAIRKDLEKTNYKGIRGEGNTGFSKANNILKNVFRDPRNSLSFNLTQHQFQVSCEITLNNLSI